MNIISKDNKWNSKIELISKALNFGVECFGIMFFINLFLIDFPVKF